MQEQAEQMRLEIMRESHAELEDVFFTLYGGGQHDGFNESNSWLECGVENHTRPSYIVDSYYRFCFLSGVCVQCDMGHASEQILHHT